MWKIILICVIMCSMNGEAVKHARKRGTGTYASAGGYAGTGGYGGNGGYVGSYTSDYDDYDSSYAPFYGFGIIDPYEFHQRLTNQILAQHAAQQNAIAQTISTGDSSVTADASLTPDDNQIQNQHAYNRRQNLYNNNGHKNNRYAPNYAVASGSIGPHGYTQTAYISPGNPSIPNVSNRFGSSSGPGGFKGVSVSSFSSSSDLNGKRTSNRGAQTTVNDNGKITTYSTHS